MIKFFRHIRKTLISENQMGKYFKYAIGEIILVVIGILIALQINNWNEKRKLEIERQNLIASLIEDFESTIDNIEDSLPEINEGLQDIDTFKALIKEEIPQVTADSLRVLGVAYFRAYPFAPNLSALKEASSSGKLSLLKNKTLFKKITEFQVYDDIIKRITSEASHAYFNGSLWEIRKTVKPDVLAGNNPMPDLNYKDYKKIMDKPLVQTALYNEEILIKNKRNNLENMLETTMDIISMLKEMQE